eukprot:scaffold94833_cov33-Tisochrysis_lutea.AAC.1
MGKCGLGGGDIPQENQRDMDPGAFELHSQDSQYRRRTRPAVFAHAIVDVLKGLQGSIVLVGTGTGVQANEIGGGGKSGGGGMNGGDQRGGGGWNEDGGMLSRVGADILSVQDAYSSDSALEPGWVPRQRPSVLSRLALALAPQSL